MTPKAVVTASAPADEVGPTEGWTLGEVSLAVFVFKLVPVLVLLLVLVVLLVVVILLVAVPVVDVLITAAELILSELRNALSPVMKLENGLTDRQVSVSKTNSPSRFFSPVQAVAVEPLMAVQVFTVVGVAPGTAPPSPHSACFIRFE